MAETGDHKPDQEITTSPPSWDEARYESALGQLEQLQERLDGLRSTIPNLVVPLMKAGGSGKDQVLSDLRSTALHATEDLRSLREDWTSPQTAEILAKTKESIAANADFSRVSEVDRYGWRTSA